MKLSDYEDIGEYCSELENINTKLQAEVAVLNKKNETLELQIEDVGRMHREIVASVRSKNEVKVEALKLDANRHFEELKYEIGINIKCSHKSHVRRLTEKVEALKKEVIKANAYPENLFERDILTDLLKKKGANKNTLIKFLKWIYDASRSTKRMRTYINKMDKLIKEQEANDEHIIK